MEEEDVVYYAKDYYLAIEKTKSCHLDNTVGPWGYYAKGNKQGPQGHTW